MSRNYGRQGSANIFVTMLNSIDMVVEFDYTITCDAIAQSYDEPASPMEYEVVFTGLYEDAPNIKHRPKNYLDTPMWLVDILQEYLENVGFDIL